MTAQELISYKGSKNTKLPSQAGDTNQTYEDANKMALRGRQLLEEKRIAALEESRNASIAATPTSAGQMISKAVSFNDFH